MRKEASFYYPARKELDDYRQGIERLEDKDVKLILKAVMLCGFRFSEIINCYFYRDAEQALIIRAPAAKIENGVGIVKEGGETGSRFLGAAKLRALMQIKPKAWKSVRAENVLDLDLASLEEIINPENTQRPKFFAEALGISRYYQAWRKLKGCERDLRIRFKPSKLEADESLDAVPAFHFYRKLFAAEYYHRHGKDVLGTVEYMRWRRLNMVLDYIKTY